MNPEDAIDLGREALMTCFHVGGPILVVGLMIGLALGLLQAMTQVQDQTVSFVPKILLVMVAIALALPWISEKMMDFAEHSFSSPDLAITPTLSAESSVVPQPLPKWMNTPKKSSGEAKDQVAAMSEESIPRLDTSSISITMPTMMDRFSSSMPILTTRSPRPRVATLPQTDSDTDRDTSK